ncbi:MAG TPA: bifunctional DedA family/phosphatase PAP2 family protein [Pseudonocardia sp.]|uniref:bifunctional DedA family/phosphatase PAP2 family protein n=1 Tax=Pseudonocardia sp. TaxID=60912 RepID=UPI002BAFD0CF|nr:bifunctional DedA family/phosphatase PAP2 family protein [Pseudonocardia sp.]HTF54233.1 bifunctional DedA family/phosphatase PAP2 family protein [Pseudonocardia sp.]
MRELIALLTSVGGGWAYPAMAFCAFLESAAFVGLVIPGETAMLLGGVLAATSQVSLFGMIAGGVIGAVLGDLAGYGLGRLAGPSVRSGRMGRWVGTDRWDRAERLLERRGGPAVFVGRWVGVLRAVVPAAAGAVNMPARKFMVWNAIGGVPWASTVIVLGYLAGSSWQRVQHWLGAAALLVGVGGAVAAVVALGFTRSRNRDTTEPASQDVEADVGPAPRPHLEIVIRSMVMAVFALVIGELSDNVTDGTGITAIDGPVLNWMLGHRTADLTSAMVIVTDVGGIGVVSAVATAVAGWLAWRHRWHDSLLVAGTTVGAGLLIGVLKPLVGRSRPPVVDQLVIETNQSYPSGHALAAAAVLGVLTVVLIRRLPGRGPRLLLTVAATAVTAAIGLSRLYLGVHWASDVIAGWLIGAFWLIICLTTAKVVTAWLPFRARRCPVI